MTRRRYTRMLIVFACGAALLFVTSGCRKKPTAPPPEPAPTQPAVTEPAPKGPAPTEPAITEPMPTEPTEASGTPEPTVAATTPPEAATDQMLVVPLVGVGPVRFGMSKEQVMEVLGQPERIEGGGVALYYLTTRGVHFLIDPTRGVRSIECSSAEHPMPFPGMVTFAGKTEKGIGMGASREQIVAAYGEPDTTDSSGPFENLRYRQQGMTFVLAKGRLVSLKLTAT